MPKGGNNWRKKQIACTGAGDITIRDFADCARPQACGRLKKSVASSNRPVAVDKTPSAREMQAEESDDLNWFEKDLEDFVIEDVPNTEEEEDLANKPACMPRGKKKPTKSEDVKGGRTYPDDLWHLLSEFIYPDDIGRFAGICQATYQITHLSSFWRKLYQRFYNEQAKLPDHAKPSRMERLHGLRARVIRSLFILYQPLAVRVHNKGPMEDDPHILKGQRCQVMWHQPGPKGWQFCFKFQKPRLAALASRLSNKLDVYHGYNDLCYNPEEGCSVLQVSCCHFSSDEEAVMGLLLTQVYVTLSQGFRHHRLRLHFDTRITSQHNSPCDKIIILDDVVAIKVFPWFHSSYPFIF